MTAFKMYSLAFEIYQSIPHAFVEETYIGQAQVTELKTREMVEIYILCCVADRPDIAISSSGFKSV